MAVAAFAAASLALSLALETVKPQWRDPEFGHRITRLKRAIDEPPDRPLVLAIGTSRTQNALFPAVMGFAETPGSPRVFNFGQTASPPLKLWLTYRRVRDTGVKPAAVLVELLPASLTVDGPAEGLLLSQAPRLSATDLRNLDGYCRDPWVLHRAWWEARLVPWYAQRQSLMSHWLPRWLPWPSRLDGNWENMDADGFQPISRLEPHTELLARAHAWQEYRCGFTVFRPAQASLRAISELVGACQAEGIPVAFYLPPISPDFRSAFAPGVYEAGEASVRELADRHGVAVFPYPEGLTEEDFMDGHHMYRHGAQRYSRWLADTHLKPWLASQGVGR